MSLPGLEDPNQGAASIALARKWRPHRFGEVVGQEHAVRTLKNALAKGRLHHAYMFTGTRGIGKTTLARILAKSFNCANLADGEPCCECDSCREVDIGNHPDVIEMDAASTTQVDNMRELLDSAQYAPATGKFKVYIIDEVHMLSRHAFNAMLKTLEEPPDHIKFILATTDPQQVPATVQSRCLRFSLRRLPAPKIAEHLANVLEKEGIENEADALSMIAAQSDGSVRDALSVLEEAIAAEGAIKLEPVREMLGLVGVETVPTIFAHVIAGDAKAAMGLSDELYEKGTNLDTVLAAMVAEVHRGQLARHAHGLRDEVPETIRDLDEIKAQLIYEVATQAHERFPAAPNPKVAFDMALLRMVSLFAFTDKKPAADPASAGKAADGGGKPASAPQMDSSAKEDVHNWKEESAHDKVPTDSESWARACAGLDVRVKGLAEKCSFVKSDDTKISLAVKEGDKYLLSYKDELQDQLGKQIGTALTIEIEVGNNGEKTPAQRKKEIHESKVDAAIAEAQESELMKKARKNFPQSKIIREKVEVKEGD